MMQSKLPWHLQTRCIRERTALLPASLSCFLIRRPANPSGPSIAPSLTGSSPASDHSRENRSPK